MIQIIGPTNHENFRYTTPFSEDVEYFNFHTVLVRENINGKFFVADLVI